MLSRDRAAGSALALTLVVVLLAALVGCARSRAEAVPSASLPPTLAATGLYADPVARVLAADVIPFTPQYPLWSDGATKRRFLRLPAGTFVDASDPDHFRFPPGAQLWKEFSFERRVETRYLELGGDGEWRFATYVWDEAGTTATLAPERGVRGGRFEIPSRLDCVTCHRGGADVVLGFSALQLSHDRDPLALHGGPLAAGELDLAELVRRGLVRGLPESLIAAPPRIAAANARERSVLGYLHSNCGTCHNASGPLAKLGLELDVRRSDDGSAPPALRTTVDVESRFQTATAHLRIVPGAPEQSVLAQRVASRHAALQMPPLGTHLVDATAIERIAEWIRADLVPASRP